MYQESKRLLKTLDDYSSTVAGIQSLIAGRLAIGMVDCLVTHPRFPIATAVRRFNEIDNDVQIQLSVASRQDLEHDIVEGRLHGAIGPFIRNISGLQFVPLFTERHELYCGVGHPLFKAPRKAIAKVDLSAYPAIIRMYHHDFDHSQLRTAREEATVFSMEAMLTLLISGGYIGYLPTHYAQQWVDRGELALIDRPELGYESQHAFITKQGGRESLAFATFLSLVNEICSTSDGSNC